MAKRRRAISRFSRQLVSKKIMLDLLDDFSIFGSIPFYIVATIVAFFLGNLIGSLVLFWRLVYTFLISFIITIIIKKVHFKDRPQKEEFDIFMEKVIASSFPSTHSMSITNLAILFGLAFPYTWVYIIFGALAILVYTQRYLKRKHFAIDIVGGIILSVIITIFVAKVIN